MAAPSNINFDQPADVLWFETPVPGVVAGGETRHFDNLRSAIKFTIEQLPLEYRASAWITTDDGSLLIADIEVLHQELMSDEDEAS